MIEPEKLLAYFFGELGADGDAAVEEHVLSCDACASRLASFTRIGDGVRALVDGSMVGLALTPTLRAAIETSVTRHYTLEPGDVVACSVDARDRFVMSTLRADLHGVQRVDVIAPDGRRRDVPFDPSGRIDFVSSGEMLCRLPSVRYAMRALAVAEDGSERVLGDYVLDHTAYAAAT